MVINSRRREEAVARAEEGLCSIGRPPYGYGIENGRYVIHEEQAQIVRLVFEMLDRGVGPSGVAGALNGAGNHGPTGRGWSHVAVLRIRDRRPFYEGRCCVVDGNLYVPVKVIGHRPILALT